MAWQTISARSESLQKKQMQLPASFGMGWLAGWLCTRTLCARAAGSRPYAAILQNLKVVLELLVNGARWIRSPVRKTSTSSRYLFIMYGLVCVLLDVVPALPRNRSNRTLTSCRAMLRHGILRPAIAYGGKVNDFVYMALV
uniref:Uncharacterized protein n=1 Tax=Anopheles merus TaxID=30066 RepID=A0A182VGW2_ANOME